jgi:hypothetical protein
MIEATRPRITGRAAMLAALGTLTAQLWLGLAPAQDVPADSASAAADRGLSRGGEAEGRVSEVVRGEDGSTLVRLADGTRLMVPADAVRGGEPVRQGAEIQAQYRESSGGGDKVVIRLRVMPEIQAP